LSEERSDFSRFL